MNKEFGLQLYSLRDAAAKDFIGTLEKVAAIGYQQIEFAGYFGLSGKEMKAQLDRLGLKAVSTHVGLQRMQEAFAEEVAFNHTVGNNYMICPWSKMESKEDVLKIADELNKQAEKFAEEGIIFGYHNHAHEFKKTPEGESYMDILIANTSPLVKLEPDVYWVSYAGVDAVKFIRKNADRVELLHLKELSAEHTNVEIGTGILDFKAILAAGEAVGAAYAIVEQEQYTVDPFESVEIGLQNLKKL